VEEHSCPFHLERSGRERPSTFFMNMINSFDIAILGGGPAGSATAIALAHRGISVALIEKTRYDQIRIGETLLPAARIPLSKLGVWEKFLCDRHAPSPANISAWGESEITENHFIFNPYGNGWHIDRARFDAMLGCAAEDAGTRVWRGTRVTDWEFEHNAWRVALDGAGEISARFLVDATGRAGILSRQMGAKRVEADRLVGVVAIFENANMTAASHAALGGVGTPLSTIDNRTLVESAENGWWYSASLPNERGIIAYMTDADLLPSSRAGVAKFWQARLKQTAFTCARSPLSPLPRGAQGGLHTFSAASYISNPIVGKSWVAVGDAAFAFDPLSSQGIYNALESGLRAAEFIAQKLESEADAGEAYAGWAQSRYQRFLLKRKWYYNQERRWSESAFWKRRSGSHGTH